MFSRSERIHHIERLKKTRKNYWGYGISRGSSFRTTAMPEMSARQLGAVVQHPKPCSCAMCCNPRRSVYEKSGKLTKQERSWLETMKKY